MINTIDYKNILVNYGAMLDEALNKKKGLALVKADWDKLKKTIDDVLVVSLIDLGIKFMEQSKKPIDFHNFFETYEFPTYPGYFAYGLYDRILLFRSLTMLHNNHAQMKLFELMMGFIKYTIDDIHQDLINLNTYMEYVKNAVGFEIIDLNSNLQSIYDDFLEEIFTNEIFDYLYYSEKIFFNYGDFSDDFYFDKNADHNKWDDFCGSCSVVLVMKCLYSDLHEEVKKKVFGF